MKSLRTPRDRSNGFLGVCTERPSSVQVLAIEDARAQGMGSSSISMKKLTGARLADES